MLGNTRDLAKVRVSEALGRLLCGYIDGRENGRRQREQIEQMPDPGGE